MTEDERRVLRRLLSSHRPAEDGEARHLGQVTEFAALHADPFARSVLSGHLTASAFILDPSCRLLLTHHRRLDIWVQLGGHADGERDAAAVALREAREESGLSDLRFHESLVFDDGTPRLLDVDVHRIPARGDEPEHDHLDLRFLMATREPDRIAADPRETKALEWVTLDEASRRCDEGMRRALRKVEALVG